MDPRAQLLLRDILRLRQVVDAQPKLRRARIELARRLLVAGLWREAEYHLRILLRAPANPAEAALLRRDIARAALRDPLQVVGIFAILPSTNINNARTDDEFESGLGTFTIPDGGQSETGAGIRAGVQLGYRFDAGRAGLGTAGALLIRNWYPSPELSRTEAELSLSFESLGLDGSSRTLRPFLRRSWYDDRPGEDLSDRQTVGVALDMSVYPDADSTVSAGITIERHTHPFQEYRDGTQGSLRLSYATPLSDKVTGRVSARLTRFDAPASPHLSYDGKTLSGGLDWRASGFATLGATLSLGRQDYAGTFPSLSYAREDTSWSVGASYTDRRWRFFGGAPKIGCSVRHNKSNVALYDIRSTDCQLSFVRSF